MRQAAALLVLVLLVGATVARAEEVQWTLWVLGTERVLQDARTGLVAQAARDLDDGRAAREASAHIRRPADDLGTWRAGKTYATRAECNTATEAIWTSSEALFNGFEGRPVPRQATTCAPADVDPRGQKGGQR